MAISTSKAGRIAIIGASGYGGLQLVKLINEHPNFEISTLNGERSVGKSWNEINPYIKLLKDKEITKSNIDEIAQDSDYAILSLPNGLSSQLTPSLLEKGIKILDLSADYRFKSLDKWKEVYSNEAAKYQRHDYELCEEAVYGFSEEFSNEIAKSRLIACPGCYPTSSLSVLIPFLKQGLIESEGIIIDAKSGTSGGGRNPSEQLLLSECSESIKPYGVIGHRHTAEIEGIASYFAGHEVNLQFTPHLVPMVRGILTTVYARLRDPGLTAEDCKTLIEAFYKNQTFIDILPVGTYPATKWVKNTNKVMISIEVDKRNGRIVLMSVIDNLLKGQAGQAIQNLNIMHGLESDIGLPKITFYP
ncbi:N-acetyl-gamma-glutamyl-phosphate reductase [Prochlorococcus marinus]|uniref:N-acetyl-gamma-glutamyl-phosphate reductase n=1 Tax=Prochlorococcus marinus XMU1408 TaxID=2213228 RepID=A0A318R4I8_PROMR|nr:N-acetyl-gamma-glutamyl-phosphate reductase [Prochlorococcus marinus]MBW3041947.1 N-acetyl-gamma-glutamyl-phosphate reductase [Prochlorococcus marinus str. XMU1408]PYE03074.1 N-acetyl-gamma-glutamyl-phosphate reductase [Prochlorococcus marinus XMU1408]